MRLRRALSVVAAAFTLAAQFSPAVSADMLDGETTRSFRSLGGGAGAAEYVLGAASGYGVQEFSAVTFDCANDDLRFDVLPCDAQSGASFADTVGAFCRDNSRRVIAALCVSDSAEDNGGAAGVSGSAGAYGASGTTGVPGALGALGDAGFSGTFGWPGSGYTVCGGTMVRSGPSGCGQPDSDNYVPGLFSDGNSGNHGAMSADSGEAADKNAAPPCSFGVAANGSAMIGEITVNIEIRNRRTGKTFLSGSLNRPPKDGQFALYTADGVLSVPDGMCALAVDVMPGYLLTPGAPVEGTVIGAITPGGAYTAPVGLETSGLPDAASGGEPALFGAPGGESGGVSAPSGDSKTASAAGGEAVLSGDLQTSSALTVASDMANAAQSFVPDGANGADAGARMLIVCREGDLLSSFETKDRITLTADISDASGKTALWRTAASAVSGRALVRHGEKVCFADSSPKSAAVIGLRPDGSAMMLASYGGRKGYSLGFTPGELADICLTLGMTDALVLGTGENTAMFCESEDGSLTPTGKSLGEGCDGVIVISVPAPETSSSVPTAYEPYAVSEYTDHSPAVLAAKSAGYNAALADGTDLFKRMTAAAAPHSPSQCREAAQPRTAFLPAKAADEEASICSLYRQLEFEATGEWLTLVIKESDLDAWYGKIFGCAL